jgi:hypothetical protein
MGGIMARTSPFPGMDPYLEQHWLDVHHNLITFTEGELNSLLPDDLLARVQERVFVESADGPSRGMYPDVRVVQHGFAGSAPREAGSVAVAEPLIIHLPEEPVAQGYIEILDVGQGNRVITVIEFLSLANKQPGEGQELYLRKQRELKEGRVSLVEIDLLRAGQRVLAVPAERILPSHRTPYQICVRRGWQPTICEVYAVPLRQSLPRFHVPLRETDDEVALDLQKLLEQCYRNGRYYTIDYQVEARPPLDEEDALWADKLLRKAGLRSNGPSAPRQSKKRRRK